MGTDEQQTLFMSNTTQTDMSNNSSSSSLSYLKNCSDSTAGFLMSTVYLFTKIFFLLPLSLLVLYLGHRRWRRQRSFATTSHSDIFTYHSAAMELIFVLGFSFTGCGLFCGLKEMEIVGYYMYSIVFPGQTAIHVLTCVERYLAVVHPLTYMGLRQSGGVRIRNVTVGCVWLLCFGWIGVVALYPDLPYTPYFCFLGLSVVVVSFCSLSVLCVLIRPGPGEVGGNREQVDQSKQRAFYTIAAILAVLWLCFLGFLVCLALINSPVQTYINNCLVVMCGNMGTVPSSSLLPLLFLHRAGKLVCCRCSNK